MALIQKLINKDKYDLKCTYSMKPTGICIHNTANNSSAKNEIRYMQNNTSSTSFHIAIDDIEAIQGIPFNRNTWHSGDGVSGVGNRNFISIEICYSLSGGDKFARAEQRAAKEVALLLKEYNWGIDRVKKHQDFSRKDCPHRTLNLGWQRFLNMIQTELKVLNIVKPPSNVNATKKPGENIVKQYSEEGTFTCNVDYINFRDKPLIETSNPITGRYSKGEKVNYDYVVITNKFVYISWFSSFTGTRRYMPVRDLINKEVWGIFK